MFTKLVWLKILTCATIIGSYLWFKPQDQDFMFLHLILTLAVVWIAVFLHDWLIPKIELSEVNNKLDIEVTLTADYCRTINRLAGTGISAEEFLERVSSLLKLIEERPNILDNHLRGLSHKTCEILFCHFQKENEQFLLLKENTNNLSGQQQGKVDDFIEVSRNILSALEARRKHIA